MYEPVYFTEQSATRGANGAVMQGAFFHPCIPIAVQCTNLFTHLLQGIPSNPKQDHQWAKKKSYKAVFVNKSSAGCLVSSPIIKST